MEVYAERAGVNSLACWDNPLTLRSYSIVDSKAAEHKRKKTPPVLYKRRGLS